jgi:hypothetical protein
MVTHINRLSAKMACASPGNGTAIGMNREHVSSSAHEEHGQKMMRRLALRLYNRETTCHNRGRGIRGGDAHGVSNTTIGRALKAFQEVGTIDRVGSVHVGIWAKDHCPPHATAKDPGGWTMRIEFSFADGNVDLLDILPTHSAPTVTVVDNVIDAVRQNLPAYRTMWWNYQQNNPVNLRQGGPCCLDNKTLPTGELVLSATYHPALDEVTLRYTDGTSVTRRATP